MPGSASAHGAGSTPPNGITWISWITWINWNYLDQRGNFISPVGLTPPYLWLPGSTPPNGITWISWITWINRNYVDQRGNFISPAGLTPPHLRLPRSPGLITWINSTWRCSSASWSCLPSSCFLDATSCSKRVSRSRILRVRPFSSSVCTGVRPTAQTRRLTHSNDSYTMPRMNTATYHRCNKRLDKNLKKQKKFKKREKKFKKKRLQTYDKNVADICHESNYYLRTLSHT